MQRKIIQIMNAPTPRGNVLYALCDDGTVWFHDGVWTQLKDPIPQPELLQMRPKKKVCRYGDTFPCNPICDGDGGCS